MAVDSNTKKFAKVHRALYKFNIQRIFPFVKRFSKKKTEFSLKSLIDEFTSTFKQKKEEKEAKPVKAVPSPLGNIVIVLFLFLLILGGYFVFVYFSAPPEEEIKYIGEVEKPKLSVKVLSSGYLDSNYDATRWYTVLDVMAENATSLSFDFIIQSNPIPDTVYILRVPNYHFASNYLAFYSRLKSKLEENGIYVSEITVDELVSLPSSRKIILIVPSGYIPAVFVGEEDSKFNLRNFVEKGNIVIYIGYKPTDSVLYSSLPNPQPISPEKIADWQISFEEPREEPSYFSFRNPLYSIKAVGLQASRPSIGGDAGGISVYWGGDGFAYFIPTTIDFWWQFAGEKSADELADAIVNARWGYGLSRLRKTIQINGSLNKQMIIFTSSFRYSEDGRVTRSYGKLFVKALNQRDGAAASTGISLPVKFATRPNGFLMHSEAAINSYITGSPLELRYSLNELTYELKQLYLSVINSDNEEVLFIPITAAPVPLKLPSAVYRFDNNLPVGEYILRITDDKRNVYAQSYLSMREFSVVPDKVDFIQGNFVFYVYLLGAEDPYEYPLRNIEVSFNGGEKKLVNVINGRIVYNVTPPIQPGKHQFSFKFGPDVISVPMEYVRPVSIFERPENIAMGLISILLFAIGYLISRPEAVKYSIDVPDFPPLQSIAVPVKREKILEMFDQINADLRWKYTPLTIADLKMGFKKILFRGKPLIVGDYNLEMILEKLKEEGYVVQAMDYYGLKRWEKETRKSIYYLALVRALRDTFVTEGIPFLPFGQRGDADTVISYGGENVYIHIYESDAVIKKAIQTASVGRTIIVFDNETTMNDFLQKIHTPTQQNITFKLLLDNKKINVAPINKFIDVLQKKIFFTY
ncbi:MAG: hypothetical protein NZ903_01955 [Candidatus Micrarchaeota archaeon]|nr:hypothetical protein [Candidatus Micrarchaeota archaeon]